MYSELIVLLLSGKEEIDEAKQFFDTNPGEGVLGLIDVVRIEWNPAFQISYQALWNGADRTVDKHGRLAMLFAKTLFDASRKEDRQRLARAGVDSFFMRKIAQAFMPQSAAYLFYISNECLIDSRSVLEILGGLQGKLFHTIFRPRVEEVLLAEI